jgi:hypothetical protein
MQVIDPTTFAVTVDSDHMGRVYAIVPDDIAHRLNVAVRANWKHYGWMGESEVFPFDHWVSQVSRTILAAVADFAAEERVREEARRYGQFVGFIVGERGWDKERKWWADYSNNRAYQVDGSIASLPDRSGRIRFTN